MSPVAEEGLLHRMQGLEDSARAHVNDATDLLMEGSLDPREAIRAGLHAVLAVEARLSQLVLLLAEASVVAAKRG